MCVGEGDENVETHTVCLIFGRCRRVQFVAIIKRPDEHDASDSDCICHVYVGGLYCQVKHNLHPNDTWWVHMIYRHCILPRVQTSSQCFAAWCGYDPMLEQQERQRYASFQKGIGVNAAVED